MRLPWQSEEAHKDNGKIVQIFRLNNDVTGNNGNNGRNSYGTIRNNGKNGRPNQGIVMN
jgi:hypothetical protein